MSFTNGCFAAHAVCSMKPSSVLARPKNFIPSLGCYCVDQINIARLPGPGPRDNSGHKFPYLAHFQRFPDLGRQSLSMSQYPGYGRHSHSDCCAGGCVNHCAIGSPNRTKNAMKTQTIHIRGCRTMDPYFDANMAATFASRAASDSVASPVSSEVCST